MTHTNPSTPAVVSTRASALRIGLTGVAAAALVAIGILAVAASAGPGSIRASTPSSGSSSSTGAVPAFEMGGRGGIGFGAISITSIDGSSISLETPDGWTRTITVDNGTTYTRGGDTILLSDLKVGDEIRFRQTLESDARYSIDAIAVIPPHLAGVVTAVSDSTITLRLGDGSSGTVKVDGSTTYAIGSDDSAALSDVEVGMVLVAQGTENADGSLIASAIHAGNFGGFLGHRLGGGGRDGFSPGWRDDANPNATASPSAS
jgi:hypothetical protein